MLRRFTSPSRTAVAVILLLVALGGGLLARRGSSGHEASDHDLGAAAVAAGAAAVATGQPVPGAGAAPAAADGPAGCGLEQAAFCDTFDGPAPVLTRSGALDNARWSMARVTGNNAPSQGSVWPWAPTTARLCRETVHNVLPNNDVFMCDAHGSESMHFMEAFDDDGGYVYNAARIRQPFDFTGRTGTIVFDVDAKTADSHGWWVEVWLTDEPVPAPHPETAGVHALPRNGIGFRFFENCGKREVLGGLGELSLVRGFAYTKAPFSSGDDRCYVTEDDRFNHFELRVSHDRAEVWASDAGSTELKLRAWADGLDLPFTRGYVSFQHAHYNAAKDGVPAFQTYHWDNIGFDGPVLPTPRAYDVPDALVRTRWPGGSVNLGYLTRAEGMAVIEGTTTKPIKPFTLAGVDLANATAARLNLNAWNYTAATRLSYRFNDGPWRAYPYPFRESVQEIRTLSIPVALSDLRNGPNTLEFKSASEVVIANIDLTVEGDWPAVAPATPRPSGTPVTPHHH